MDANTMGDVLLYKLRDSNYSLISFDDREKSLVLNMAMDQFISDRVIADLNVKQKGFEFDTKRKLDLTGLISAHTAFKRSYETGGVITGDFMLGNEDNGAKRTPDRDYQMESIQMTGTTGIVSNYGIFCRIPDECLFIISESCDTSKQNQLKLGVPVEEITYETYNANINNSQKSPYYNKVWRLEYGSYTPADIDDISVKFTDSILTGFTGMNASGNGLPISIATYRAAMLIPGKDWQIDKWHLNYIKRPSRILVDTITPANQRNCELHPAVHNEIIEIAVRLAIAAKIPEQQKYQIADKEQKETE
jgi:hypothetical protein